MGLAGGTGARAFVGAMVALWMVLAAGRAYAVELSVDRTDDPDLAATPTADNGTSATATCPPNDPREPDAGPNTLQNFPS